jgi:hypothetical protein
MLLLTGQGGKHILRNGQSSLLVIERFSQVPSVGQAPRRRKVWAETAPVRAAATAIEQMHFMLDAIERRYVMQGSQGRDKARRWESPDFISLHSSPDLHTSWEAPARIRQPPSISLPGSKLILLACSPCANLGRGRPRAIHALLLLDVNAQVTGLPPGWSTTAHLHHRAASLGLNSTILVSEKVGIILSWHT